MYGNGNCKAQLMDGFLSDHRMIMLEVQIEGTDIGKSYWKCNSELLKDDKFKEMIMTRVPEIIAANDTENISRTLLLETTLCVLRGEIIKYTATQK